MIKILLSAAVLALTTAHNILDFGAQEGSTENTARAFVNSLALTQAIMAANSSVEDRTVLIPSNQTFVMMPISVRYLWNVTL